MFSILGHFRNAWLVILMRLGLVRVPYFCYRIRKDRREYAMLARPSTTSMADLFVLREIFVDETYRDLLPLLPAGPVRAVDVGANLGSFAVWLHRTHGLSEGYCFEPDPTSFGLCRFNLLQNGCSRVTAVEAAVGGVAREVAMRVNTTRPGGQGIYQRSGGDGGEVQSVRVVAFAEWLKSIEGTFDVLKLDCEGAEWEILETAPAELWHRFRIVIAEIHGDPSGRRAVGDFAVEMQKLGFTTVRWDGYAQSVYLGRRA